MSVLSKLADSLADSGDDIAMLSKASSNLDDVAARKAAQFELLQKTNPMLDNYHTGIRSAKEINRLQDLVDKFDADNMFTNPDFTIDNARAAVAKGTLPVFSSKPIEPGVFVSPSKMMATDYAGGDASKVFSKEIPLDDFAAILSGDEGNYLPIARNYRTFATGDEAREYFSKNNPAYWDSLPSSVDEGMQEYTRNGYSRVNDMLRTGQDNYGYPDTDVLIGDIERGIEGYNLPDDIKVYRRSMADAYKNLNVGDTFTDEGFTSTSISPNIGGDFGRPNVEINVGNGKGVGAFIGDLSSGNGDEGEFLLQRGTKYKVLGRGQDGTLQLEVIGNERRPLEQILSASNKRPTRNPNIFLGLGGLLGGGSALASMMGDKQSNDTI